MDEKKKRSKPPLIIPKKTSDFQRLKLERLMKDPSKPVIIPDPPKQRKVHEPPEFVRNVMGSSAGAGSGEFHVYRHLRRKEYSRQKFIEERARKDKMEENYHKKIEQNKHDAEMRTAKKRQKRLKKKEAKKLKKLKPKKDEKSKTSSEDSDENSECEMDQEEGTTEENGSSEGQTMNDNFESAGEATSEKHEPETPEKLSPKESSDEIVTTVEQKPNSPVKIVPKENPTSEQVPCVPRQERERFETTFSELEKVKKEDGHEDDETTTLNVPVHTIKDENESPEVR